MNTRANLSRLGVAAFVCFSSAAHATTNEITLDYREAGTQGVMNVHSRLHLPVSVNYSEYVVQRSTNMVTWEDVAGPFRGGVGVSDELLRIAVPRSGDAAFYRVISDLKIDASGGGVGEAVFGYSTVFSKQLQSLGQLPMEDFVEIYTLTNEYLPQISFDPTAAEFWNDFNIDPAVYNATSSYWNQRLTDFRLNPEEFAVFQTNGFVVSQRLGKESFADIYYDIYADDLPVFISTDSILHAWHRSFEVMLEEIEETQLIAELNSILDAMAAEVPDLWAEASGTTMTNGVQDADYFLAVARSLAKGSTRSGSLGQSARVNQTLDAINAKLPIETFKLYGEERAVDFSQFKVRGHYTDSIDLTYYFRAMMWCAIADFRYAGDSTGETTNHTSNVLRELSGAVALNFLLQNSGEFDSWLKFNRTLEMFVGTPDSLNLAQLNDILNAAGIDSPADLPDESSVTDLQAQLMSGTLGMQQVTSGYYYSPFSSEQMKLPRSFTFMGQRFVMDSWALSKNTFDDIIWDEDGIPGVWDKMLRRVPSALDVAFTVFGNNQIVPELAVRIADTNGHYWRDGWPYQHNLAATRNTLDLQEPAAWTSSIYTHWLACLRELSAPTTDPEFPEAMRTRPWAMKTLNTQLASWTQLRHDTVLYVEQSYTPILLCSYPDGYVEPRVSFWQRLREMAVATREVLSILPTNGVFQYWQLDSQDQYIQVTVAGATMYSNRLEVMDNFIDSTELLTSISQKELSREPLATNETSFLQQVVELDYLGKRTYGGWYPSLFYEPGKDYVPPELENRPTGDGIGSDYWDALVTDVHTDPPDAVVGDPGSILHEGVGNVYLMMVAVDCGPDDLAVYAGPVLSHYEFELGPTERMTDGQWKTRVATNGLPPQPTWTESYLVPNQ